MASIQMIYSPIRGNWTGASHQFLLYSRDDGSQEIVRGGPQPGHRATALDQISELASLRPRDNPSPFGKLTASIGTYDVTSPDWPRLQTERGPVLDQKTFDSYFKQTLREGGDADLDVTWKEIQKHAKAIDSQGLQYSPLGPNSNSLVSEALRRSGIEAPKAENGRRFGERYNEMPWAPGAGDRLETSEQANERQRLASEAALERRPLGNLLASLKLVEAEPVSVAPSKSMGTTMPKALGVGFGD